MQYTGMLGGAVTVEAFSAALFSIQLNLLNEALGPLAAMEVLKILGEYVNRRFNSIGGFSARHSRDEILTIFPHTSTDRARQLVADFAQELKRQALPSIQDIAVEKLRPEAPFDIYIRAGITKVSPTDTIDQIIENARSMQEIVATQRCQSGGHAE